MIECQFCLLKCENSSVLKKHQSTSKLCMKYKNISFICNNCNFKTVGIKNIQDHICDEVEYEIEDEIITENNQNEIEKLKILLSIEKTKTDIYKEIIKQNTNIKLNKILETKEDGLHIYDKKLSIFIHNSYDKENIYFISPCKNNEDEKIEVEEKEDTESIDTQEKPTKKTNYKNIKNIVEYRDEISDDEKLKLVADKKLEIQNKIQIDLEVDSSLFKSVDDTKALFKTCITSIKENARTYSKNLENMKNIKLKLIKYMTYKEYKELLENHLKTLIKIFEQKKYTSKKITDILQKSMNKIDLRILFYGNYTTMYLDIVEIQNFQKCLENSIIYEENYVPYNNEIFFKSFHNYGSVIFTIKENIERYIFNYYGFNNIIYIPIKQSTEDDPYSFYILDSINKNKRFWNMDCRLEELTNNFINNLKPYLIQIFRKLYSDVFNDNDYRENYEYTNVLTENDCKQLLDNIVFLINKKELNKLFRNIVREKSTYIPTENDKINFYGDDYIQKKRFAKSKDNNDVVENIKLLFDNITSEEAVDLYRSHC